MSDLISRQYVVDHYDCKDKYGTFTNFHSIIEFVNSLPAENKIISPDYVKSGVKEAGWIRIDPDLPMEEQTLPDDDTYVLLSFSNYSLPTVGRCKKDEGGCSFFAGDDDVPLASVGIIVNGWQPLPQCLSDNDEDDTCYWTVCTKCGHRYTYTQRKGFICPNCGKDMRA